VLARQNAPVPGAMCTAATDPKNLDDGYLREGQWQISVGYRKQYSFRHFVGTVEQHERVEQRSAIVNDIHLFDVGITYGLTRRTSFSLGVPFMHATRFRMSTPDRATHSAGLGDISMSVRTWLLPAPSESGQNISIGVGVKFPTGKPDVRDTVITSTGTTTQVVDQSIQLGDGGTGLVLDMQAFKNVWRTTLYASGVYLINPRGTNGVRTGRGRASEAIMSVADQYLARAGAVFPVRQLRGLAFSFGGRIEGVPVRDIIGKSEGFRRPGYAISVEPGVIFTKGKYTWNVSAPIAVERNRRRSVTDIMDNRHGDAAFADYILVIGFSRRF
jgi:hypothetical protein